MVLVEVSDEYLFVISSEVARYLILEHQKFAFTVLKHWMIGSILTINLQGNRSANFVQCRYKLMDMAS